MDRDTLDALHRARAAEKEQALFYRALAAEAETVGDPELAERLNGLLADEQHHLSRLTARLLELGERPASLAAGPALAVSLGTWESAARVREAAEVARYEALLGASLDAATLELVRELLEVERMHEATLGGKWTPA